MTDTLLVLLPGVIIPQSHKTRTRHYITDFSRIKHDRTCWSALSRMIFECTCALPTVVLYLQGTGSRTNILPHLHRYQNLQVLQVP